MTPTAMTIYCKLCDQPIRSAKPDAQKDVLIQMGTHLKQHQEDASVLAQSVITGSQLLATYMLMKLYVRIPPEEKELLQSFQDNEEQLLAIFGMEPDVEKGN